MREVLDRAGEGILVIDDEWRVVDANDRAGTLLDTDLDGTPVTDLFPAGVVGRLRDVRDGEGSDAELVHEEYFPAQERWFEIRARTGADGLFVSLYDVTRWARREQDLSRRQAELGLLTRVNDLVQALLGALVGATSRAEIEATVVEGLVATDVAEVAWVATWGRGDDLEASTVAGRHADVVDHLTEPDAPSPERAVLGTGDAAVVREIANSENVPAGLRRDAFAHGIQAAAAVPLSYGETVFGALGVYTARPGVLAEGGLTGLVTLGEVAGFAVNATRNRQTLRSATRRELDLTVEAADSPLAQLASETDADVSVQGTAEAAPDRLLCYASVSGVDAERAAAAATSSADVDHVRLVKEREAGGLLELGLGEGSPLLALVDQGATIQAADAAGRTLDLTVQTALASDLRDLVESLQRSFPSAELRAKRTTDGVAADVADATTVYEEELTDRQRLALQTAYSGGYFESPRESTAEQLADSIGISSPTFHHHLRAAHRKLLDAVLSEDA